ncbi:MAG TPA: alpha/beta hydrolase [Kofleriaceae bacterium]|jgi:predicted alpha/beta hydrolase
MQELTLPAIDGRPLAARAFAPPGPPIGAVLVANAMGVPQAFYAPLAAWLAARGYLALTFDYRGTGASRTGSLRDEPIDVVGWARLDATAALRELQDRAPGVPLSWLGHSLGGQIVPFVPDHVELAKLVTIATGSGYWRESSPPLRRKAWVFWFVAAPLATPLCGYFPGRRLGMVGDLPRNVLAQWKRWCMDPDYAAGAEPGARELFGRVRCPVVSISFTDDEMMSARNTESLHAAYPHVTLRRFAPADLGVPRVGHFGFFKQPALWDALLARDFPAMC